MGSYRSINVEDWKRKQHYAIFRNYENPRYEISFEVDITNFLKRVRENKWSFTLAMIHTIATCANEIEEFRYRFEDGKPVVYDKVKASFTYLNKETELLKNIIVDMEDNLEDFMEDALETIEKQTVYFTGPVGNDSYQFSSIPWIPFTHISHTDSGKKDNAVPMFDWGKYYEKEGRMKMPFSIEVHHSFVDGIQIGKFYEELQQKLDQF